MTGPAAPPPLEIGLAPEYVVGFPVHVAVTMRVDRSDVTMHSLPAQTIHATHSLGILLARGDGAPVVEAHPAEPDPDGEYPRFSLSGGQSRRMLTDLSPFIPRLLPAGRYRLTVVLATPAHLVASEPAEIVFRRPEAEEEGELERLAPELRRAGSWGLWTLLVPPEPPGDEPVAGHDPLRLNRLLRYFFFAAGPIRPADLARLDVLDGLYAPEADALRAELLFVMGDREAFDAAASRIRGRRPGLTWWVDRVAAGGSTIAWQRMHYAPR